MNRLLFYSMLSTSVAALFRFLKQWALPIVISAALLGLLFWATSNTDEPIDFGQVLDVFRRMSPLALAAFLALQLIGVYFRAVRYRVLLRASGDTSDPGMAVLIPATLVRNMTVDLLPARVGELAFAGLLKQHCNTGLDRGLSALLFAALFDAIIILPLIILLFLIFGFEGDLKQQMMLGAGVLITLLTLFYAGLRWILPYGMGVSQKIAQAFNLSWLNKFIAFAGSINTAIQTTLKNKRFLPVLLLSFGVRCCKYGGLLILFYAVVTPSFPALANTPIGVSLSGLMSAEIAAGLPMPTFLSLGTYEAGGTFALKQLGLSASAAFIVLLSIHLLTQLIDYGMGLLAYFRLYQMKNNIPLKPTTLIIIMASLMGAMVAGLLLVYSASQSGDVQAAGNGQRADKNWIENTEGFIVWGSNRDGEHHIYRMALPDRNISQISDSPYTETQPKISPDGRFVVYQRARKTEQGFLDYDSPWDLFLYDHKTQDTQLLTKNASQAQWLPSGEEVSFTRGVNTLMAINVNTNKERVVLKSTDIGLPEHAELQTPVVNSKGDVSVATRRGPRMTGLVLDGRLSHIGSGCQIRWTPDETGVYRVATGGRQKNQIFYHDVKTREGRVLLDMPGEFSHEYFPKFDNKGEYMVFAASRGDHDHRTADYELFLWPIGYSAESAERLTFNAANDSWPDIYLK